MFTQSASPRYVQLQNMYQQVGENTPYKIKMDNGTSYRSVVDASRKASPELLRIIEQQKHGS